MNAKPEEERTPAAQPAPRSQRRPAAGEELTMYVPPPSVRAYAREHLEDPGDPGLAEGEVEVDVEVEVDESVDVDFSESKEAQSEIAGRTRIVPAQAVQDYARRKSSFPELSLVRSRRPEARAEANGVAAERGGATAELVQDMFNHLASREYAMARLLAESILEDDPEHKEAKLSWDKCGVILEGRYVATMGSMDSVPAVRLKPDALCAKTLDPQAAFILSRIDGATSVETLLDLCGMPRLEALRMLYELHVEGVIGFE